MNRDEAGRKAEEQMAFYLRRHFDNIENVHVLNDIRLVRDGDVAQMDHVIVHPFGLTIIESKSVSTAVRVNARGEWERRYGEQWRGMPSPILQARRQGELLKFLLDDHTENLLAPIAFGLGQSGFGTMALDVVVAVSDNGRIQRQRPDLAPEAIKADQVPDRIRDLVREYRRASRSLNPASFVTAPRSFNPQEMLAITTFLRAKNTPLRAPEKQTDAYDASTPALLRCRNCGVPRGINWTRKAGYYFDCKSCGEAEIIEVVCPKCSKRARISKSGHDYSIVCGDCDVRIPYVTVAAG